MRRILVPLDGSSPAESIIPDACDLAGRKGEIVLLHVIRTPIHDPGTGPFSGKSPVQGSEDYLLAQAIALRKAGYDAKHYTHVSANVSAAIDEAAVMYNVDMTACSTHGRGPGGRLLHGGIAWRMVAQSRVPVLLRHIEETNPQIERNREARVLVPLDGSQYAEKALPLAADLVKQWHGTLDLVRVVETVPPAAAYGVVADMELSYEAQEGEARTYLRETAAEIGLPGQTHTLFGSAIQDLKEFVLKNDISHVIMASHGRTALSRVILGSVADQLVHALRCPIIVVPALASVRADDHKVVQIGAAQAKESAETTAGALR